jgi:hypothetical protein
MASSEAKPSGVIGSKCVSVLDLPQDTKPFMPACPHARMPAGAAAKDAEEVEGPRVTP